MLATLAYLLVVAFLVLGIRAVDARSRRDVAETRRRVLVVAETAQRQHASAFGCEDPELGASLSRLAPKQARPR